MAKTSHNSVDNKSRLDSPINHSQSLTKIRLSSGPTSCLGMLRKNLLSSSFRLWQNPAPSDCVTEVPVFSLAIVQGPLSALGGCLLFIPMWSLMENLQHDYCCFFQVSRKESLWFLPLQPAGENFLLSEDSGFTWIISFLPFNITESPLLPTLNRMGWYQGKEHWESPWNSACVRACVPSHFGSVSLRPYGL